MGGMSGVEGARHGQQGSKVPYLLDVHQVEAWYLTPF